MRRNLLAVFVLAALSPVCAGEEPLTLPATSQETAQTGDYWESVSNALGKAASYDYGFYIGAYGGAIGSNWGTPTYTLNGVDYHEGDFINQGQDAFLIMAGRQGTSGLVAAFVYGQDIEAGSRIDSLTFSASGVTDNPLSGTITLGLTIVDSEGNQVAGVTPVTDVEFSSTDSTVTSATLDLGSDGLLWQDGYKVVAVIKGLSGDATTAYMIDHISSSFTMVPEPATATLGLLALAGLAARRRRK